MDVRRERSVQEPWHYKLNEWLESLCRREKAEVFIEFVEWTKTKARVRLYTKDHCYAIVAHVGKGKNDNSEHDYLGCQASTRKPRAGETWTRGNDLPDGPFNEYTWKCIVSGILGYELVKIVKPARKIPQGTYFEKERKIEGWAPGLYIKDRGRLGFDVYCSDKSKKLCWFNTIGEKSLVCFLNEKYKTSREDVFEDKDKIDAESVDAHNDDVNEPMVDRSEEKEESCVTASDKCNKIMLELKKALDKWDPEPEKKKATPLDSFEDIIKEATSIDTFEYYGPGEEMPTRKCPACKVGIQKLTSMLNRNNEPVGNWWRCDNCGKEISQEDEGKEPQKPSTKGQLRNISKI